MSAQISVELISENHMWIVKAFQSERNLRCSMSLLVPPITGCTCTSITGCASIIGCASITLYPPIIACVFLHSLRLPTLFILHHSLRFASLAVPAITLPVLHHGGTHHFIHIYIIHGHPESLSRTGLHFTGISAYIIPFLGAEHSLSSTTSTPASLPCLAKTQIIHLAHVSPSLLSLTSSSVQTMSSRHTMCRMQRHIVSRVVPHLIFPTACIIRPRISRRRVIHSQALIQSWTPEKKYVTPHL